MHRFSISSLACLATLGLGLTSSAANAADNDVTTSFSGYGTVAGTVTSNRKYEYMNNLQQFKGATDQLDIGGDSRFGLQGTVAFGSQFSVTAQALASRVGDKDFDINTEWLFGQYEPIPGVDLRLGRVVLPTFLFSDTRNVGYAQTWLRAPNEVYSLMPYKTLDGAQVLWRADAGGVTVSSQLSYGKMSATLLSAGQTFSSEARNVMSAAVSAEKGNWLVRVSASRFDVPTALSETLQYTLKDKFVSGGLQYDNGTAIVLGEWTRRTENDAPVIGEPLTESTQWYVAGGWRIDKFTPMVRYVSIKPATSYLYFPGRPSVGLSLRYDVMRNVALKAQIDRYDAALTPVFKTPSTVPGTKVNVMSVGADFVF